MILDVKNKKILTIVFSLLIVFILGFIFIQNAFFKPTKLNYFIASKIYKTPANTAFTDESFYKCVVDSYNEEKKTKHAYTYSLSDDELASLNKLYCSWAKDYDITDTTGLEKMVGLTHIDLDGTIEKLNKIDLSNNVNLVYLKLAGGKTFVSNRGSTMGPFSTEINELDISNNVALKELYVERSKLTNLDISNNLQLEALDVGYNQLLKIDVSKNTNLQYLSLGNNKLSSIDLTNNTKLEYLNLYNNLLTSVNGLNKLTSLLKIDIGKNSIESLNVSGIETLKILYAEDNKLTSFDVSANTELQVLEVGGNQLTFLNIEKSPKLTALNISQNQITSLDTSKNTELINLSIDSNQLTELDLSKNVSLVVLDGDNNQLTTLDISNCTKLSRLFIGENQLTELNLNNNSELTTLYAPNNQLTKIDLSNNSKLTSIYLYKNKLTELDLNNNKALNILSVYNNQLTSLNLSECANLYNLNASNNKLTTLNLSNNTLITRLDVGYNQLIELDVSKNTNLINLNASNNKLTAIDVSKNTALTQFDIRKNKLTNFDVSNNLKLVELYVEFNQLTNLDISKNTNLTTLYAGVNQLTNIDVSSNIELVKLDIDNNQLTELDVSNNPKLTNLYIYSNPFAENKAIYKNDTFDNTNSAVKLPEGKTSTLIEIKQNKSFVEKVDTSNQGDYQYDLSFKHSISGYGNSYTVKLNLYVIEATSDKYDINAEEGYIYTKTDTDEETILSNISLNYGEASIEDNKLLIKYDGELIKSFDIVNISSNKYDISKNYIYLGLNDLSLEDINTVKGEKVVEDNKLKIKYNDNILKEYDLIKISSEKYDLTKEYIFDNNFNVNNVTLTNGTKELKDNKLLIKYSDELLESYDIVSLSSEKYDLTKNYIFTEEELNLDLINTTILTKEVTDNKLVIKYNNEIFKSIDIVNISSSKYDLSKKYIYTFTEELDLSSINVVNSQKSIENNRLLIKYNEEVLKTYDIVSLSSEKYDLTKGYIFDNEFDINNITLTNGTKEVKDNQLLIKYDDELLQAYDLISVSSDKYDLTKDYIYIGTSTFTLNDFYVTKIKWTLKDGKLEFKSHNGDLIKEYQVISINFGEYKAYDGLLVLPENTTYEEFTNNITTNGVTCKIFSEESEITEGNISEGMIIKIYYDDEVIDEFEVTNEYLEFDESLNIDNEISIIEKLPRNLKLKDFVSLINTSGSIEVRNNNNELLNDDSIIGTGSKLKITLSNRNVEYTLSVRGDVTGNGQAKMADVMKIATHIIEGNVISGNAFERAADITGDGKIKMNDVMKLATFIIDGGEL